MRERGCVCLSVSGFVLELCTLLEGCWVFLPPGDFVGTSNSVTMESNGCWCAGGTAALPFIPCAQMSGKVCVSACAILGAAELWSQLSCQSQTLHPVLWGCQPTTVSEVFAVVVLKTNLSCVNPVPAPAGSCKQPLWGFSAFSSFFSSAGSCCFVATSNFFWAVALCVSLFILRPACCVFFHLASRGELSSLLVDYFVVNLEFWEGGQEPWADMV